MRALILSFMLLMASNMACAMSSQAVDMIQASASEPGWAAMEEMEEALDASLDAISESDIHLDCTWEDAEEIGEAPPEGGALDVLLSMDDRGDLIHGRPSEYPLPEFSAEARPSGLHALTQHCQPRLFRPPATAAA